MWKRKFEQLNEIRLPVPVLLNLIEPKDEATLYYACRALNHHLEDAEGKKERIQALMKGGICSQLVQLVVHPSNRVAIAAVHIVGHIAEMGATMIQAIVNARIIPRLVYHLDHSDNDIKKEVAWAIERTLDGGSFEQLRHLADEGCIPGLCGMLSFHEAETVLNCLKVLEYMLEVGKIAKQDGETLPYAEIIKECGGIDKIKTLQDDATYENPEVRDEAAEIIRNYFAEDY